MPSFSLKVARATGLRILSNAMVVIDFFILFFVNVNEQRLIVLGREVIAQQNHLLFD